jgi:hypothetical protein
MSQRQVRPVGSKIVEPLIAEQSGRIYLACSGSSSKGHCTLQL